ncbi:MAG: dihydrofolate reductase family protein [Candidatus Cohnella colombiensis]|uniref:Dihydrofolate reductase family protein n=1 Tax=Candidatus Cohnella colombiensis TaxID=3121368 RepID=A0AA95JEG4_9BACL|nr:MAG: dihydrofolate reductase family protein [Cohnella sp.]
MRRLRYQVACSLDGFIAGLEDEFDWITPEPSFDFEALHAQFEIILMGRRTYEIASSMGGFPGKHVIVASRSLSQEDHPDVEVVSVGLETRVHELREQTGRDIWLYGGGTLLSQLLTWNLVDTVEPAIIPILLGGGVPLLASQGVRRNLKLIGQTTYPSGMVLLKYEVQKSTAENR